MKLFRNILASVAAVFAVASCTIVPEDAFSTAPVAPVMSAHKDILITTGTVSEDVTFSWEKARFIDAAEYTYDLFVVMGEKEVLLANDLTTIYYTLSKPAFRDFMKQNFTLEQNSTHSISVYAAITDDAGVVYKAEPLALKVYVYDDAVPSVVSAEFEAIVLDKDKPGDEVALLSWGDARLVYGEDVTYNVALKYGDKEVVLASGIYDQSYKTTVDALNEAVVSAGGAEEQANEVTFVVYACCPSIPKGVSSNEVKVNITTYVATFTEQYYMPGSYQGWDPASAATLKHSTKTKGLYQGFVNLTTQDGSDVEFKFSPVPKWEGDFGFSDVTVTVSEGTGCASASARTVASDNIKVPSGFYYVRLDKKFNTLDMVQVKNLELIGSFAASGWGTGILMNWDAAAGTWTASEELDFKKGDKFLIRFNSAWDHKFGGTLDALEFAGADIEFTKEDGTYMMIFNADDSDFALNAVDVNMPDYLVVAGDYSGHAWSGTDDMRVNLYDSSKGLYRGYITMYDAPYGFKFVKNGSVWIGQTAVADNVYTLSEGGGDNCTIANGSYFWTVDIINMTATATPITKVGIIGSFAGSGWGSDVEMTFDAASLTYSVEQTFAAGDEWKFRFNGDWGYNLGASGDGIGHDGANFKVETAGTYVITLDMAHGSVPSYTIVAK